MKRMNKADEKVFFNKVVHKSIKDIVKQLPQRKRFIPPKRKRSKLKSESWLLQVSDIHNGLRVNSVEVGGMAEYNPQITVERLNRLLQSVVRIIDYSVAKPKELVIAFQGDNIDNAIMRGQQYGQVAMGIFKQVTITSEILTDFVIALSAYFPKIK